LNHFGNKKRGLAPSFRVPDFNGAQLNNALTRPKDAGATAVGYGLAPISLPFSPAPRHGELSVKSKSLSL
jgi:hypothetical protein